MATTRQRRLQKEAAAAAKAAKAAKATLIPEQEEDTPTMAELMELIKHQQEQIAALRAAPAPGAVTDGPQTVDEAPFPQVKRYQYRGKDLAGLQVYKPLQGGKKIGSNYPYRYALPSWVVEQVLRLQQLKPQQLGHLLAEITNTAD